MKFFIVVGFLSLIILRIAPLYNLPFKDKTVRISGQVINQPTESFGKQTIRLGTFVARLEDKDISYGDFVIVEGVLKGNMLEEAVMLGHRPNTSIFQTIHTKLTNFVANAIPEPHAGLINGIVLGDKQTISKEWYEKFKLTGTAHVVVASGMNVTLTAGFALSILILFIKRKKAAILSICLIWIYVAIAGVASPLVRAAIMSTIAFWGVSMGRSSSIFRALFIGLGLMIIVFPWWIFDIGMWLSFTATLSLILFGTKFDRLLHFVPHILREGLSTSLAASIGVTPILLLYFGQVSLIGPIVNALVLWTVTPLMIIGLLGILIGYVIPILGTFILFLALPLTTWFLTIIDLFA